ncbi:hypothetical protein SAY87_027110 [Trapa incisa]|uniref:BOI-related E3 ubiquitin-protein ligase 3 n=1 Tax=Trapa incisa TaxID=236973 RepID=A0AAN7JEM5_9MYRT|nr:hypothetical protein SAY87_027110 [Trapa incisa]
MKLVLGSRKMVLEPEPQEGSCGSALQILASNRTGRKMGHVLGGASAASAFTDVARSRSHVIPDPPAHYVDPDECRPHLLGSRSSYPCRCLCLCLTCSNEPSMLLLPGVMFAGDSSNPSFPFLQGDNQFQYDSSYLPQLQLFGDYNRGRNIATNDKHEAGHSGSIFNPQPVSTGLKLAYEEDEHNSSISSASGGMTTTLPAILSLNSNLKNRLIRRKKILTSGCTVKGVKELQRMHTVSLMSEIEKGIVKKLQENDLEIENMNLKKKELEERIKQVMVEVQSWQNRAKYSELVINVLKKNLQQVMAQGAVNGKEGCGDSEVDDSASYANPNHLNLMDGMGSSSMGDTNRMSCKACKAKVVSVLFLPCRRLCLCKGC